MNKPRAVALMAAAYTLVAAVGVGILLSIEAPALQAMFLADLVGTVIVFGFSRAVNNSSMYDPYWSVIPIYIGAWWWVQGGMSLGGGLLMVGILAWGIRLTWNFLRGWPGLEHEDWRYVDFRRTTGRAYWLVSFSGIHLFPTLTVFAAMLPAYVAFTTEGGILPLQILGMLVCLAAAVIQGIADNQLATHRASSPPKGSILDSGLWRYSRHPNYFGEVLFWWGVWLFGVAAAPGALWPIVGPLSITGLFVFISVPMTDRKTLQSRPHYAEHMKKVSGLIPLPRRG